jgi:hypothetical protein
MRIRCTSIWAACAMARWLRKWRELLHEMMSRRGHSLCGDGTVEAEGAAEEALEVGDGDPAQ